MPTASLYGQAKEKSLYDRLGGKKALTTVQVQGKDMKSAHARMNISSANFDALVQDLVGALDKFKVGQHEKDQLLGALGPMKGDIVEAR